MKQNPPKKNMVEKTYFLIPYMGPLNFLFVQITNFTKKTQ